MYFLNSSKTQDNMFFSSSQEGRKEDLPVKSEKFYYKLINLIETRLIEINIELADIKVEQIDFWPKNSQ